MAVTERDAAEACAEHPCCIKAVDVQAPPERARLSGEWHLRWMADDHSWFLAPPYGNVIEIRVSQGDDPAEQLAVEGIGLDDVRRTIRRRGLFPPC